ncbi:pantoate--beta-alanine ligase [Litoribacter ruber]|uniref:Pantothenate synthetase n=1 Tax=Litoribacter ruber TaxID=702568 RepID=A0AAP2CLC7_9BACT|nr:MULTISPECIES: pantoate--beta-alanine ligase [Litoribacter]MBS9525371.1 pantoate--beta-alanine ligase [Litoribacter alkaliphilus]MBT0809757.1 pantoate--beta-alanine ligase [Litoribacter ruber]
MKILRTRSEVKSALAPYRKEGKTIGLVPTMGALHEGHLSLVEKSKSNSDITISSIYVNPTQFNNPKDLEKYPRPVEKDLKLLEDNGVDFVFLPDDGEMYPSETRLKFDFADLEKVLEGEFRPGHFNGVGIVVSKLFHIIQPDHAYFGQKDLQQVAVIKRLVNDLSFGVEIITVDTMREKDGLAMSSRNIRLDDRDRLVATILYRCLTFAKDELLAGRDWFETKEKVTRRFLDEPKARLEYFELVKADTMEKVTAITTGETFAICTAAFIKEVRLIDNLLIID